MAVDAAVGGGGRQKQQARTKYAGVPQEEVRPVANQPPPAQRSEVVARD
jgi:hypothetical protein